jgi:hypothetical protein
MPGAGATQRGPLPAVRSAHQLLSADGPDYGRSGGPSRANLPVRGCVPDGLCPGSGPGSGGRGTGRAGRQLRASAGNVVGPRDACARTGCDSSGAPGTAEESAAGSIAARGRSRRRSATQAKPPAPPPRVNSLRRRWGRHSACRDFYHGLLVCSRLANAFHIPARSRPLAASAEECRQCAVQLPLVNYRIVDVTQNHSSEFLRIL